jgi:hypothetical protein
MPVVTAVEAADSIVQRQRILMLRTLLQVRLHRIRVTRVHLDTCGIGEALRAAS